MKITYSWIKEFVDVKSSPEKLSEQLSMAGLSVAACDLLGDDWVYDIEVTSNRPDWLSVRGIVREVAAITGAKFKKDVTSHRTPDTRKAKLSASDDKKLSVSIEDKKACPLYYGALITGVKVGPSPDWLKKRLEALGLRSVNNVVDITNYCLLEYGQPLHAFDYHKLEGGSIVVRRARAGEKIVLIDGIEKELSASVLVIADNKKALAIAGIMGGRDSEVTEATSCLMLESAYFDPIVVRRATRSVGVATDSSYRFERGVDGATVKTGMDAAIAMIGTLCGGAPVVIKQAGDKKETKAKDILFNLTQARDILSIGVSLQESKIILEKLGFGVKQKGKGALAVRIPSFRRDVSIEEDITEEIARVYGYEKIPLTTPEIKPFFLEIPKIELLKARVKNTLVSTGLKEVVTYSLVSDEFYTKSAWKFSEKSLCLENPLSQEYRLLRTTLVPSLLNCAALNINRNNPNFEIFEVANVYDGGEERLTLGILLSGSQRATWQKDMKAYTLFDLKGICEVLLHDMQIDLYESQCTTENWLNHAMVAEGITLVSLAQVPDAIKRHWGIKSKEDIFVAEINLSLLAQPAHFKKVFKPLSTTPLIQRDISVFVPEAVTFEAIKKLITQKTAGYLKTVGLIECYQGKEIPQGFTGLTISCAYGSDTRTLSDAEINPVHQGVLDALVKELSLTLR